MKYIPNNHKKCTVCGKEILYNEEYVGMDALSAQGDISSMYRHALCWPPTSGSPFASMTLSAVQMMQQGPQAPSAVQMMPVHNLATPLTPYGMSLKPPLWKRILRLLFGGHNGKDQTT